MTKNNQFEQLNKLNHQCWQTWIKALTDQGLQISESLRNRLLSAVNQDWYQIINERLESTEKAKQSEVLEDFKNQVASLVSWCAKEQLLGIEAAVSELRPKLLEKKFEINDICVKSLRSYWTEAAGFEVLIEAKNGVSEPYNKIKIQLIHHAKSMGENFLSLSGTPLDMGLGMKKEYYIGNDVIKSEISFKTQFSDCYENKLGQTSALNELTDQLKQLQTKAGFAWSPTNKMNQGALVWAVKGHHIQTSGRKNFKTDALLVSELKSTQVIGCAYRLPNHRSGHMSTALLNNLWPKYQLDLLSLMQKEGINKSQVVLYNPLNAPLSYLQEKSEYYPHTQWLMIRGEKKRSILVGSVKLNRGFSCSELINLYKNRQFDSIVWEAFDKQLTQLKVKNPQIKAEEVFLQVGDFKKELGNEAMNEWALDVNVSNPENIGQELAYDVLGTKIAPRDLQCTWSFPTMGSFSKWSTNPRLKHMISKRLMEVCDKMRPVMENSKMQELIEQSHQEESKESTVSKKANFKL